MFYDIVSNVPPVCRNWQTRQTQNLLVATPCGFKSRSRHEKSHISKRCIFILICGIFICVKATSKPVLEHIDLSHLSFSFIFLATTTNLPSSTCDAHVESVMSSSPYSGVIPVSYGEFCFTKSINSSNSSLSAASKNS